MIFLNYTFPYMETLLAALIGAIIGQLSVLLFNWLKKINNIKRKKRMIFSDLKHKLIILKKMKDKLAELKKLFEDKNTKTYTGIAFHDLNKDVYESISKIDLYECMGSKMTLTIDIYESINFLKTNTPFNIYSQYVEKLNKHLDETKNDSNHDLYCTTHIDYIQIAVKQIESNLKTIGKVECKINELVND